MLPPKSSHHAKFDRDRSNQLGDGRGVSIGPDKIFFVTDGQKHPDRNSRLAPVQEARLKIMTRNSKTKNLRNTMET